MFRRIVSSVGRMSSFTKTAAMQTVRNAPRISKGRLATAVGTLGVMAAVGVTEAEPPQPKAAPSSPSIDACIAQIRRALREDQVDTDPGALAGRAKDNSYHTAHMPNAITYCETEADVVAVVKACHQYGVPMIPFGTGTSLEGHVVPTKAGGVIVDVGRMDKVLEVHADDLDVVVQPGISWEDLNEFLLPYHLYFAPDPGPGASIGGMCGTSCSGTRAWKHGTMKENVISVRVVLPDGRVIQTRRRPSKSSAGYNLTGLLLGSEGTLGVITEITLKLKITPEKTSVAMIGFNHIDDAAKLVSDVVRTGVPCNRMEMMDDVAIQSVNNSAGMEHPVLPTLLVEFAGSQASIEDQALTLGKMAKKHGAAYYKAAADEDEAENLWEVRKTALFAAFTLRDDKCEMIITDVAVPVSRLSDMLLATKSLLKKFDLTASIVSHAGDGNFHCFLLVNREVDGEMHRAHEFQEALVDAALDMDGTCTGEHGVGKGKMGKLVKELGPDAVDVMRQIKFAIDRKNLFNPDHVFETSKYHEAWKNQK